MHLDPNSVDIAVGRYINLHFVVWIRVVALGLRGLYECSMRLKKAVHVIECAARATPPDQNSQFYLIVRHLDRYPLHSLEDLGPHHFWWVVGTSIRFVKGQGGALKENLVMLRSEL